MKRLRNILRYNIFIVLFVITVTGYVFYYLNNVSSYYSLGYNVMVGKVLSYKIDGNLLSIDLYAKEKLKIRYYFGSYEEKSNFNINLGDIIEVSGELEEGSVNSSFHLFNYRKYLLSNGIKYVMKAHNIKYVYSDDLFLIRNSLRNRIINIDSNGYLLSLIMHDNSYIDYDNLELLNNNGLGRSIIISGFHLILFVKFIDKIIKKNKYHNYICIFILLFYLLLVGISFSLVKSILLYIIMVIFKKRKIFSLTIAFGLFLLINPYYVYNVGFIYSVVISYALSIFRPKNYFNMIYIITLVSFPIDIYYNFEFKLLNPIFNIIFIPIISYFIFPLSWISLIIGNSGVLNFLYSIMLLILNVICKYNISINICYPGILIFFYYVVIYYSIKNRKIYYLIVVLINLLIPYLHSDYVINYIDVGQGDSILIEYPYDRKIILIDTGGIENFQEEWKKKRKPYSVGDSVVIPYLKSRGINIVDFLIISHGDFDHMGEAINLVNNFKVEKVIFNCGPYNDLENELIKVLDKKKIKYYSCIKELNIDKNKLYFLQTKEYDNENDNSNVIYTELNGYKFMFMGDASSIAEKEILDKYNLPDINVLKVGHHGSKTSSSTEFIDTINPKYSIISVGKNNRYGHPNKEALDNLKDSKIYRTDQDGSIMFKIKNNKLKVETCSP